MTNKLKISENPSPVQITDSARLHIDNFLTTLGEQAGFRLGVKKSGCSGYAYIADVASAPTEQELCFKENGVRLFITADSIAILQGTVIDLIDKGFGQKQLCFNNPNIEDSCGCGESFTVKSPQSSHHEQ